MLYLSGPDYNSHRFLLLDLTRKEDYDKKKKQEREKSGKAVFFLWKDTKD